MAKKKQPVFYAKDIKVGDLLIVYLNLSHTRINALLVIDKKPWHNSAVALGVEFTIFDLGTQERYGYCWDETPMVFDELISS
jgi:hypothetical protein